MSFFSDALNDPNINWGSSYITVRTKQKQFVDGYTIDDVIVDKKRYKVASLQLLDPAECIRKGFGDYADGEVYECFSLTPIKMNNDIMNYATIIFNGLEYEILKCSPFGVKMDTSKANGYWDIYFGRRSTTQGGRN